MARNQGISAELRQLWLAAAGIVLFVPNLAWASQVYWIEGGAVRRASLEGGGPPQTVVAAAQAGAFGWIALDPVGGRAYWNGAAEFASVVRRGDLYGTQIEFFAGGGDGGVKGVATDISARHLYYVDPSDCLPDCASVRRVALNGTGHVSLVPLINGPDALAIAPALDRVVWADLIDEWIRRTKLNGTQLQTVVPGLQAAGLAIDEQAGKIYWTEYAPPRIRSANLNGSGVQNVVTTGLVQPHGVAVDSEGGLLYWTDRGTGKIQRSTLTGASVQEIVTGLDDPLGLALDLGQGDLKLTVTPTALDWEPVPGALRYDIVGGDLAMLRAAQGVHSSDGVECLADGEVGTDLPYAPFLEPGEGVWLLVRAESVTGHGTYDSGGGFQAGTRDVTIAASGEDCP